MLMLLSLLAPVALPVEEDRRVCSVTRTGAAGTFYAEREFLGDGAAPAVSQRWSAQDGKQTISIYWTTPEIGAPPETANVFIELRGVPKGVDRARIEFWQGGRALPNRFGPWINLTSLGYRQMAVGIGWGNLRAIGASGPVTLTVADTDGDSFAQWPLIPQALDEPVALAEAARAEFAAKIADPHNRCDVYREPEIIVT